MTNDAMMLCLIVFWHLPACEQSYDWTIDSGNLDSDIIFRAFTTRNYFKIIYWISFMYYDFNQHTSIILIK